MMMQKLRKYMKYVLFIALLGFAALIFFNWGANVQGQRRDGTTDIAVINGQEIPYRTYIGYKQMKEQQLRGVSDEEIWSQFIEDFMWQYMIGKEKITVTDEELWMIIRNNPPPEIMEADIMKNEQGEFDFNKYLELLRSPQSRPWLLEYERSLREQIPREKLRSLFMTFGWISPQEDSLLLTRQLTSYDLRVLSLPLFSLRAMLQLSEAEARAYYEEHREEFKTPEQTVLRYVFFKREASFDDSLEARERLEDFLDRIEEGEDFLTIAQEVSDDTAIVNEFEPDNPVALKPYLMNVYKEMKNGEISDIIQASHGYEIIQRIKAGLVYKVRADIQVSMTTKADIYERIEAFKEAAKDIGFDSAAVEMELVPRQTYPIVVDNVTFPVRDREALAEYLPHAKKDRFEGPFSSIGGYYVFTLDTLIPATTPDFESIQPQVEAKMEREILDTLVNHRLTEIYEQLVKGTALNAIIAEDSAIVYQGQSRVQLEWVEKTFGEEVAGRVAKMTPGEMTEPVLTDWAGYIIVCDSTYTVPMDSSMVLALQMKRQARLEQIMMNIFTPKKIEDNRDIFFE